MFALLVLVACSPSTTEPVPVEASAAPAAPVAPAEVPADPASEAPIPAPGAPAAAPAAPAAPTAASPAPVQAPPPAASPTPAAARAMAGGPVQYRLVPKPNALFVVVTYERGTIGAALAHDHAIVATTFSGTVRWDPANPSACQVSVDVPTSGLRVDPPGARAKAGLEGPVSESDHPKIEENFNSRRQLDSTRFPVLTFRSTGCEANGTGFDVTGPLTVHGLARPTTARMTIEADGTTLRARGRFGARHADFGMEPYSNALGAVKNAEPLAFVMDLTAVHP